MRPPKTPPPYRPSLNFRLLADRALRRAVFIRDDFTCRWCGWIPPEDKISEFLEDDRFTPLCWYSRRHLHVDHVVPRCRGGQLREIGNLQTLCDSCNSGKGGR